VNECKLLLNIVNNCSIKRISSTANEKQTVASKSHWRKPFDFLLARERFRFGDDVCVASFCIATHWCNTAQLETRIK